MMNNNEVEIIESDIVDLTSRPAEGGLLDTNVDNILYLADKAEKYVEAMNRIMNAALKITTELDWVIIGGTPYLQESGATKVARLFGISIQLLGKPTVEVDSDGYKTFTYKGRFMLKDDFIEALKKAGKLYVPDNYEKAISIEPDKILYSAEYISHDLSDWLAR